MSVILLVSAKSTLFNKIRSIFSIGTCTKDDHVCQEETQLGSQLEILAVNKMLSN